ncbi:MAG: methyltransferase [Balneolaceae bacterium]|nr:methyltransferase [Balneolaceae bacterium]
MQKEMNLNNNIARSFGKSAQNYHQKAEIQRKVANGLVASLRPWKDILPEGPILEVGCGTGFLTGAMINEFPNRAFTITDASSDMVNFAKEQLGETSTRRFEVLNVDTISSTEPKYACIVSNFAAQWFGDTAIGLEKLGEMLLPGGLLLVAFPGNYSFAEWYECCLELGLPFTANPLPDVEEVVVKLSMGPFQIDYYENDLFQTFDHAIDFFKHIKEIGAGKSLTGKSLNAKQLRLLAKHWDEKVNPVKVKWHVVYLAAKKDGL